MQTKRFHQILRWPVRLGPMACGTLLAGLALGGTGPTLALDPRYPTFLAQKRQQAEALAQELDLRIVTNVWRYFDAGLQGDWQNFTNLYERIRLRTGVYQDTRRDQAVHNEVWQLVNETYGAFEQISLWDRDLMHLFVDDVMQSVPPGSIYFGGTDPGRYLITAFSESHREGKPFFTLSQNPLADLVYLHYLRSMYGNQLYIPTTNDSQQAFQEYLEDAQRRMERDQLKPGEDVRIVGDRVQVSGQIAVMMINGLLAKVIFDKNPDREFYVEESFPLDWMYLHLTPRGFIMKLNRQPVPQLSDETLRADREFWQRHCARLIGDWLTPDTSVQKIRNFVEQVYHEKNRDSFKGDMAFLRDQQAQKCFSKLRSSIGGVYAWRTTNAKSQGERERMAREADFAFRQAFALCPYSPEAVFRYTQLLLSLNRRDEALGVATTSLKLDPKNDQLSGLVTTLKQSAKESAGQPGKIAELEKRVRENPEDFQASLNLAAAYFAARQTNRAIETLDTILSHPNVNASAVLAVGQAYAQMNDLPRLEQTLGRLVRISANSPEAWYDLAAVRVSRENLQGALEALDQALKLSAERKSGDPSARDLKTDVLKDARFSPLRKLPEFQKLVGAP